VQFKLLIRGMLAFATMASAAQAGPAGGIGRDLAVSAVEKISARHCMRGRAGRGCERADGRRVAARYHAGNAAYDSNATPAWYPHDSNALPFGSKIWWEQKEREGGGGDRP
jgi:hypothetical protein